MKQTRFQVLSHGHGECQRGGLHLGQLRRVSLVLPALLFLFAVFGGLSTNLADDLEAIEVHPLFQVEEVAREPLVNDPVDLQFDEHGTAFVVEMGGYPFASEEEAEFPGKVVFLKDDDQDGRYDRRVVFADRLRYANSILPYRGGLLVASPPDLLFLKDTDGDGKADHRDVLITGFAVGNSQHNFNGLIHGLDNWVYAGNGGNSGTLFWPDRPGEEFPLRHRDMKFDFERQRIEFFGQTTTGFAVAIDDYGHIFTTHNTKHINHMVFPNRYLDPHPYLSGRQNPDISDHKTGSLDRIYAIGVQEARLNHPEQSGYFSCSCGITYYGGGAFPEGFNGNLFVADSVLNLIHRDVLRPDGPGFVAGRGRDKVEFLASADRHCRPVNMRVGPEGALYIVDMYRPVIEHPEWIPDELEQEMDLYAGTNQGRIYRVTPRTGLKWEEPRFSRAQLPEVVARLGHANRWWRDTAQRLLVEWNDPEAVPLLEELIRISNTPKARLQALWTLRGMTGADSKLNPAGLLRGDLVLRALSDPEPGVRENALILAEASLIHSPRLLDQVLAMSQDDNARVRMQIALTLGTIPWTNLPDRRPEVLSALAAILDQDMAYEWSRFAVLTCAAQSPMESLAVFLAPSSPVEGDSTEAVARETARLSFLTELGELIGTRGEAGELARCLDRVSGSGIGEAERYAVLSGVGGGLGRGARRTLPDAHIEQVSAMLSGLEAEADVGLLNVTWNLRSRLGLPPSPDQVSLLQLARDGVADRSQSAKARIEQLRLLGFSPFEERQELLFALLDFRESAELQREAMRQLTRGADPAVAARLIAIWTTLSREARSAASDFLIYRSQNHDVLLTAMEEERLKMGQLNLDLERRRRLLWSSDAEVRRRAEALFSDAGVVTRAEVLQQMKPALELSGDAGKGLLHYTNLCASCHTIQDTGFAVGPDLTEIYRKGAATLMLDILDPNAAVNTEYLSYTIEDKEGEIYSGIVVSESESLVTLRAAGGLETTITRDRIDIMEASGLSLMPEGLESGLTTQDVADLLAFLQKPK